MDAADTNGLDLAPFRGLRYDPARVGDLAAVTSPPYDVVEPAGIPALEQADPYNIVRLVLPHNGAADRHAHAGATLRAWRGSGILRPDPVPALYVYEQRTRSATQRGLIGALALDGDAAVLPHEDVIPAVVDDRAALMEALDANPEPILLAYHGDGAASDLLEVHAHGPALLDVRTPDGTRHRLWAMTDPEAIAAVRADLAPRSALIADGHHRWAGYRRLRDRAHAAGRGSGAWDRGLVLLVDTARYPLQVGAIHRVLPQLDASQALDLLATSGPAGAGAFLARPVDLPVVGALAALDHAPGPAFLLVSATGTAYLLSDPDPDLLAHAVRPDRPEAWRTLDATVLHAALLDQVWRVPDDPEHISYLHDASGAVREARRTGGSAILLRPVTEELVRELAQQGVRMPRKSTSFNPKPATGLVLRALDM